MPNPLAAANVGALPNTGVDPGSLNAQGPQVNAPAMKVPPPMPGGAPSGLGGGAPGGAPGGQMGKLQVDQVSDLAHKLSAIGVRLNALLKQPGPIPRKDVIDAAVKLVSQRLMSAQSMAQTLKDLPEDPQDIREWVQRHATDATQHQLMLHKLLHGIRAPDHPLAGQLGPGFVAPPGGFPDEGTPAPPPGGGQPPTLQ